MASAFDAEGRPPDPEMLPSGLEVKYRLLSVSAGETPTDRSDPNEPAKFSNWPDYTTGGRPRSFTVVIRKTDGGVIGT